MSASSSDDSSRSPGDLAKIESGTRPHDDSTRSSQNLAKIESGTRPHDDSTRSSQNLAKIESGTRPHDDSTRSSQNLAKIESGTRPHDDSTRSSHNLAKIESGTRTHDDSTKSSQNLAKIVECPVCLTVQKTLPNPCCPIGHIICEQCGEESTKCPTCKLDNSEFTEDIEDIVTEIVDLLNEGGRPVTKSTDYVYETEAVVLKRREKQVMYGKNSVDYDDYIKMVPKHEREVRMPRTPDKNKVYSRRQWDGAVKAWKLNIHSTVANLDPGRKKALTSGLYYSRSVLLMLKKSPLALHWPPPLSMDYRTDNLFDPVKWYSATSPTSCRTRSRLLKEAQAKYRSLRWDTEAAITYRNLQQQVQRLRREVDAVVGYKREDVKRVDKEEGSNRVNTPRYKTEDVKRVDTEDVKRVDKEGGNRVNTPRYKKVDVKRVDKEGGNRVNTPRYKREDIKNVDKEEGNRVNTPRYKTDSAGKRREQVASYIRRNSRSSIAKMDGFEGDKK